MLTFFLYTITHKRRLTQFSSPDPPTTEVNFKKQLPVSHFPLASLERRLEQSKSSLLTASQHVTIYSFSISYNSLSLFSPNAPFLLFLSVLNSRFPILTRSDIQSLEQVSDNAYLWEKARSSINEVWYSPSKVVLYLTLFVVEYRGKDRNEGENILTTERSQGPD